MIGLGQYQQGSESYSKFLSQLISPTANALSAIDHIMPEIPQLARLGKKKSPITARGRKDRSSWKNASWSCDPNGRGAASDFRSSDLIAFGLCSNPSFLASSSPLSIKICRGGNLVSLSESRGSDRDQTRAGFTGDVIWSCGKPTTFSAYLAAPACSHPLTIFPSS